MLHVFTDLFNVILILHVSQRDGSSYTIQNHVFPLTTFGFMVLSAPKGPWGMQTLRSVHGDIHTYNMTWTSPSIRIHVSTIWLILSTMFPMFTLISPHVHTLGDFYCFNTQYLRINKLKQLHGGHTKEPRPIGSLERNGASIVNLFSSRSTAWTQAPVWEWSLRLQRDRYNNV